METMEINEPVSVLVGFYASPAEAIQRSSTVSRLRIFKVRWGHQEFVVRALNAHWLSRDSVATPHHYYAVTTEARDTLILIHNQLKDLWTLKSVQTADQAQ
ncbi:MAG: hypothetical protein AB7F75_01155 [Planctomycetota bacterium]